METRPEERKYHNLISSVIISIMAVIMAVAGFFCIAFSFMYKETSTITAIYGLSCIVLSVSLFIIGNMAKDIHYQTYLKECQRDEDAWYHEQSLQELQDIREMLQLQHAQKTTHNSNKDMHSELVLETKFPVQKTEPQRQERYSDMDSENDYTAQFRRPASGS